MNTTRTSQVMTPAEVAEVFCVDVKTVGRWEREGKLPAFRTPGNHRRFRRADIERFLNPQVTGNGPVSG